MKSGHAESNTPEKRLEPKNHPIEKENHLPNLHFLGSMLIFQGVYQVKAFLLKFRVFLARVLFSQFHHKLVAVKLPSHRNITQTNSFVPPIHLWIYYVYIYIYVLSGEAHTHDQQHLPKKIIKQVQVCIHLILIPSSNLFHHFWTSPHCHSVLLDKTLLLLYEGQASCRAWSLISWRTYSCIGRSYLLRNMGHEDGTWDIYVQDVYIYIHIQKIKSFEIWNHLI